MYDNKQVYGLSVCLSVCLSKIFVNFITPSRNCECRNTFNHSDIQLTFTLYMIHTIIAR